MKKPTYIEKKQYENKGLDYYYLRAEGEKFIQELASDIWTDYNEHDPGVTILEQLCYALTDLSFRCQIPLKDLLTEENAEKINTHRQALFIPKRIFPCNPLTVDDYRKLVFDAIPGLGNVWFVPLTNDSDDNGLYEILLYWPSWQKNENCNIKDQAKLSYCAHRNLCEDYKHIKVLDLGPVSVSGKINIHSGLMPEEILARILFTVSNYFAPGCRRYSLANLLKEGLPADEIFTGPLLKNGFIKSNELAPFPGSWSINFIIKLITGVDGVASINGPLSIDGSVTVEGDEIKPLHLNNLLDLITRPLDDGLFSFKLFQKGLEVRPNPEIVELELGKLRARFSQSWPLDAQYEKHLGVPKGQWKEVETWYSIQEQFPNTYGIGSFGLPQMAPLERKGKAKQLKGYLLVFEQLMADFFSQLAHVKDLFSIEEVREETYFYQYLTKSVPNVAPLLKNGEQDPCGPYNPGGDECAGYKKGLRELIKRQDNYLYRRNRFLDFLLALYGETIDASSLFPFRCREGDKEELARALILAKTRFLDHLVTSTMNRGKAFNYLEGYQKENIPGMLIKIRILLGMAPYSEISLSEELRRTGFKFEESWKGQEPDPQKERAFNDYVEKNYEFINPEEDRQDCSPEQRKEILSRIVFFRKKTLFSCLLQYGDDINNYKIGKMTGCDDYFAAFWCPENCKWFLIGRYCYKWEAVIAVLGLIEFIKIIKSTSETIIIIENNLLFGPGKQSPREFSFMGEGPLKCPTPGPTAGYKNSITVITSYWPCKDNKENREYKDFVKQTVIENCPAHILPNFSWLGPVEMLYFECLYATWLKAMEESGTGSAAARNAADKIIKFLAKGQNKPETR